ncbi:MAG: PEP-CTERM sorting domain-containing protein [Pirellulales bacterium]|nr:PEP-CTERM sorting domain-containing protein [Pirellulales bacterium]
MFHRLHRVSLTLICLTLVAGVFAWTSAVPAATIIGSPVALSTLVSGGNITAGDKTFTNFTYLFTGDMPGPVNVNVVPIQDDLGNYGIEFQGAFVDLPSSVGGSDAKITYTVTAGGNWLISDAHMAGNPNLLGETGSVSVTETFLPLGANGEFTMEIYDDEGRPVPQLVDSTIFTTPSKSVNVQKDILIIVPTGSQSGTISFIDQTFSQIEVPEPASMVMLGGIVGLAFLRRR